MNVAVTGIGLVTPAGLTTRATWDGVCAGRSTAAEDPQLATLPVNISCRIPDYNPSQHCPYPRPWQYDRYCQLALTAAHQAVMDAELDPHAWDGDGVAVVVGSGLGGITSLLTQHQRLLHTGARSVSAMLMPQCLPNMAAGQIALRLAARGPVLATATACASGATAIGTALELLRSGACHTVIAGGTEAAIHPLAVAGFHQMGALSTQCTRPASSSRPFDAERDGFVLGEGAAILVLETAAAARARGRPGYALLTGYGASCDAHHAVAPDPTGAGAELAIRRALASAGATAREVDHVNAHGTSTQHNDAAEATLIHRLYPHGPSVTAPKGVTGHLLGAAGALEAALTALAVSHSRVPPIANLHTFDPALPPIDTVATTARNQNISLAVSHSFGFGGHNTALAFRPCDPLPLYPKGAF
ncbi:beta-ketoacyl-[acyl-carrier-protein] synthase family protein [Streptomyces shenzhenensis]|uniref:beta-ketoacyl-[acyl-carrier-protein] synthase family protein n=1 Tax=Streptomyces shenzhenensis TaxID=943815 RepID=UPI0033D4E14D